LPLLEQAQYHTGRRSEFEQSRQITASFRVYVSSYLGTRLKMGKAPDWSVKRCSSAS